MEPTSATSLPPQKLPMSNSVTSQPTAAPTTDPTVSTIRSGFNHAALGLPDSLSVDTLSRRLQVLIDELPMKKKWPSNTNDFRDALQHLHLLPQRVAAILGVHAILEERFGNGGLASLGTDIIIEGVLSVAGEGESSGTQSTAGAGPGSHTGGGDGGWNSGRSSEGTGNGGQNTVGGTGDGGSKEGTGEMLPDKGDKGPDSARDLFTGPRTGMVKIDRLIPVEILKTPTIPLAANESTFEAFNKSSTCPSSVYLYHGTRYTSYSDIRSFQTHGVVRGKSTTFYSRQPAAYWTSSSAFAIWWAARKIALDVAAKLADASVGSIAYARDAIPRSLNEVNCLVVECKLSKAALWGTEAEDKEEGEEGEEGYTGDWFTFQTEEDETNVISLVSIIDGGGDG